MQTFTLKNRDTRPILEVALEEPDPANPGELRPHDLTPATSIKLHIRLANGTTITRDLVVEGLPTAGVCRYSWVAADWNVGGLVPGSTHQMEYEVISAASRMTFPNDGYDRLVVLADLGQS